MPYVGIDEWFTACSEKEDGCLGSFKYLYGHMEQAAPVSTKKRCFDITSYMKNTRLDEKAWPESFVAPNFRLARFPS